MKWCFTVLDPANQEGQVYVEWRPALSGFRRKWYRMHVALDAEGTYPINGSKLGPGDERVITRAIHAARDLLHAHSGNPQ